MAPPEKVRGQQSGRHACRPQRHDIRRHSSERINYDKQNCKNPGVLQESFKNLLQSPDYVVPANGSMLPLRVMPTSSSAIPVRSRTAVGLLKVRGCPSKEYQSRAMRCEALVPADHSADKLPYIRCLPGPNDTRTTPEWELLPWDDATGREARLSRGTPRMADVGYPFCIRAVVPPFSFELHYPAQSI